MDPLLTHSIEVYVTHPRTGRGVISAMLSRLLFPACDSGLASLAGATHVAAMPKGVPYRYPDGRASELNEARSPKRRQGKAMRIAAGKDSCPASTQPAASTEALTSRRPAKDGHVARAVPAFALDYPADDGLLSMQGTPTLVAYLEAHETRPLPVRVTERVAGRSRWFDVEIFHGNAARWYVHKAFAAKDQALAEAERAGTCAGT